MPLRFDKHFTLEEANALVPALRELFAKVHSLIEPTPEELDAAEKGIPATFLATHGNGNGNGNGHGKPTTKPTPQQRIDVANDLLKSVAAKGIVIQDWRRGLIDFPALRDGEEIFLCYELADGSQIQFFHDLDSGYAGRQPL